MKCERCNKDHDGSYGSGRFCSSSCARARVHSKETKDKISKKCSEIWNDDNYRNRMIEKAKKNGTCGWSEKARRKGTEQSVKNRFNKNLSLLKEGKYELLSEKFRRKIVLEEASYKCESCNNSHWLGKPLWLEIHHIDDDGKNNKRENLMVLCPNCHSALDSNYRFRGRKHRK
jgi:Zn finger protein HypA/HybF involved in hydrogenase expression